MAYEPQFDFSDFQSTNPTRPLPGHQLDVELWNISDDVTGLRTDLKKIQRSDGALNNGIVKFETLAPDVIAKLLVLQGLPSGYLTPEHFGAVGDGVSDDAAAFTAALNGAGGIKIVGAPGATYRIGGTVAHTGSVDLDLSRSRLVADGDYPIVKFSAPISGPYALTANYVSGATTLAVAAMPRALKAGERIRIVSDARDPANRDAGSSANQYRVAEDAIIGVGSTTTTLVLAAPLRFTRGIAEASSAGDEPEIQSYTLASSARVIVYDPDAICSIKATVSFEDGHAGDGWASRAVEAVGYGAGSSADVTVGRGYYHGLALSGTYMFDASVRALHLEDNNGAGQIGYGVADAGTMTRVRGSSGPCRHAYTTNRTTATADSSNVERLAAVGRTVGAVIDGWHHSGPATAGLDTHHDAEDVTFRECTAEGADIGFSLRGRNLRVMSPRVLSCGTGVYAQTEYNSGDPDDDFFTNGKTLDDFTSVFVENPIMSTTGSPLHCNFARLDVGGVGDYTSVSHEVLKNTGGILTITGSHNFVVTGAGTNGSPIIGVSSAIAASAAAIPTPETIIAGDVTIDARAATSTGVTALLASNGAIITVTGRLHLILPAGCTLFSTTGTIRTLGEGQISYEVIGAADNSITRNTTAHAARVIAVDGTVDYDGAIGSLREVFRSQVVGVSHAGTGTEVQGVYTPPGQSLSTVMAAGSADRFRIQIHGSKTGTAGTAQLFFRSGGTNLVTTLTLPNVAVAVAWSVEVEIMFTGSGAQRYSFAAFYTDGTTTTTQFSQATEAVSAVLLANALILGVNAPTGAAVTVDGCVVEATRGGRA